ncbi:hypothetical protein [Bradyrhizobium lablabi]|uniref:Uncharacterized protein n=1 Tax=Bradyrhizobium lablabi TaxID=722472 RepID=A0A1H5JIS9_9BRAD|nr:hypothetical protein [Bradyrhizobium lablabi]SEE52359.1 hypothetical protein SAMN05444171_7847 [Bradyrhizobium lablabi]
MSEIAVTSYTELIAGINAQREALGVRMSDFDDLAGFPAGLTGKAFGMLQVKRLGPEKLFDALRAAGLRLKLEPDPEQLEKMKQRIADNFNPRQANQARACHSSTTPSSAVLTRVFKAMGRSGGKERWRRKSKKDISAHMRMMVMARERKRRKAKRLANQRRLRAKLAEQAGAQI